MDIRELELDRQTITDMIAYHTERLIHYNKRLDKVTMEMNRARRLKREGVAT